MPPILLAVLPLACAPVTPVAGATCLDATAGGETTVVVRNQRKGTA